jgi:hypothetical protein
MGYTHYWNFAKAPKGKASETEAAYQAALIECQRIVKAYYRENGGLSGYTAHAKTGQYGGLNVNGKGDDAHETFAMREHFSENDGFGFCKTARKPYDVVVTACLAVLAYRLPGLVTVSSDGRPKDWTEGVALARKVLRRKVPNPIGGESEAKAA